MPHGGETNWTLAAMHDPAGRRGIWYRETRREGRLVAIEVCGGREGDDYYARFDAGVVGVGPLAMLDGVLGTSHWMLGDVEDLAGRAVADAIRAAVAAERGRWLAALAEQGAGDFGRAEGPLFDLARELKGQ